MKKIFAPIFCAIFFFFIAQVAFKAPSLIRCDPMRLTQEFLGLPISMLAIAAFDTLGIACIVATGVSFATFMFQFVSYTEVTFTKTNKS